MEGCVADQPVALGSRSRRRAAKHPCDTDAVLLEVSSSRREPRRRLRRASALPWIPTTCDLCADILDLDFRAQHEPAQALQGGRGDIARQDAEDAARMRQQVQERRARVPAASNTPQERALHETAGRYRSTLPLQKCRRRRAPRSAAPPCAASGPSRCAAAGAMRLSSMLACDGHGAINGAARGRCQPPTPRELHGGRHEHCGLYRISPFSDRFLANFHL